MTEEKKGLFGKLIGGAKSETTTEVVESQPAGKKGFFAKVRDRLTKTKSSLVSQTLSIFQRRGKIDEEMLEEMEVDKMPPKSMPGFRVGSRSCYA